MSRRVITLRAAVLAALAAAAPLHAQSLTPGPPGPFVVDLRGAMSGLPQAGTYYAPFPVGTVVAKRGFGFDVGAHVYPFGFRKTRIGLGADLMQVRGTASTISTTASATTSSATEFPDVTTTARLVVTQLSVNFGSRDGWSYLSVGGDAGRIASAGSGAVTVARETHTLSGFNLGGGARWFLRDHFGVGFDVRFHRFSTATLVSGTAGITLR